MVDALGQTTQTIRDEDGLAVDTTRADGVRATARYDGRGNGVTMREAVDTPEQERTTSTIYEDTLGLPAVLIDGNGNRTTLEYDGAGNVTRTVDAEGTETVLRYDDAHCPGLPTTSTTAAGLPEENTTTFAYDPATCNLARVTDPTGNVTTFQYDAAGNAAAVTDGNGHTTRFVRDALNRITRTIDASTAN